MQQTLPTNIPSCLKNLPEGPQAWETALNLLEIQPYSAEATCDFWEQRSHEFTALDNKIDADWCQSMYWMLEYLLIERFELPERDLECPLSPIPEVDSDFEEDINSDFEEDYGAAELVASGRLDPGEINAYIMGQEREEAASQWDDYDYDYEPECDEEQSHDYNYEQDNDQADWGYDDHMRDQLEYDQWVQDQFDFDHHDGNDDQIRSSA